MSDGDRFRDGGSTLGLLAEEVQVVCPRCGARAFVRLGGDPPLRRLACPACGYLRDHGNTAELWGGPVDPWFRQELWLREPFGAHVVWAYNGDHARLLRAFVEATHRERGATPVEPAGSRATGMSMVERLPAWFKAAENRTRLTRILDGLLERAG